MNPWGACPHCGWPEKEKGDKMTKTKIKHSVRCATCGKGEIIKVVKGETPENWFYGGKMDVNICQTSKYEFTPKDPKHPLDDAVKSLNPCYDPKAKHKFAEYWECPGCVDKGREEG